jgi:hypothetical protein
VLAEHAVLTAAMHEAARQVSLHCSERGAVVLGAWARMRAVFSLVVRQLALARDDVHAVVAAGRAEADARVRAARAENEREIEAVHRSYASLSELSHSVRTERDRSLALADQRKESRDRTAQNFETLKKVRWIPREFYFGLCMYPHRNKGKTKLNFLFFFI